MDSTRDLTKIDQLSIIIRYIKNNYKKNKFEIKEFFIDFYEFKHHISKD